MLTAIKALFSGAGSLAGLLPFAPWIIALVLGLGGAGGWFWQQHQIDVAHAATLEVAKERDAANVQLGAALSANKVDEQTIADLQANNLANDSLIAAYEHQAEEDARISAEAGNQIRNLQNADAVVDTYLRTPIPDGLRAILNGPPQPNTGNQNGNGPAPKANAVPAVAK
jgi:uncharacterized protein HemX